MRGQPPRSTEKHADAAPQVLFLTQWFPPEPVLVPFQIVDALISRGARVRVVTGTPNYPSGRVAAGYSALRSSRELVNGADVWRAQLFPSHDSSPIRRIANYLSFAMFAAVSVVKASRGADVCLVYLSPATVGLAAWVGRVVRGVPYVLMVQDVWPDSVTSSGMVTSPLASRAVDVALSGPLGILYRDASAIIAISEGMRNLLVHRGAETSKTSVIYNWANERLLRPIGPRGRADGVLQLLYAGNLGHAQGLDSLVGAMALIAGLPVRLRLVGTGAAEGRLRSMVRGTGLTNVSVEPAVAADNILELMASADVQVVSLRADPLFRITVPSKLQAAFAVGQPVLAIAEGDVARLVEGAGAGVAATPGSTDAIAAAIRRLVAESDDSLVAMGVRGLDLYSAQMSATVGGDAIMSILMAAAEPRRS